MTEGIHLGDLALGVNFDISDLDVQRALTEAERRFSQKVNIPVGIDANGVQAGLSQVRVELDRLTGQSAKASREQAAAAKSLEQQYRATGAAQVAASRTAAAESAASAARIREQAAQLALFTRMSNQADREAAQATRAAMQARREAIDALRLDYSRLRTALDSMTISEAEFNEGGDKIIRKLKAMGDSAEFTARELKQLSDLEGRIGREQNSVAGILNPAGLSGNVAVGIQSALPGILQGLQQVTQMSPSLGAAASQVTGIAQGLSQVRVAAQGAAPHTLQLAQGLNTSATASGILRGGAAGAGSAVTGLGGAAVAAGAALGGLAVAVTAGAAAASKAVNEYAKLEYSIAQVSTLTNQTPAQMQAVGQEVLNISRNLGMSYQDIAAGLYDVLGAGVKGTEDLNAALEFTEEAAKLAIAGATTTATATDVLTSAMNAYKLSATDTQAVSDALFQAVKDGKMTFNDLAGSLGMVTAIAADADVPLQTVLAALATMTANGVKASSAVDYLRSLIKAIVAPGEEAAKAFDALGIAYGDNALKSKGLVGVLQEIVQKTGGSTEQMVELLGGIEAVTAATSISSGEFDRMKANLDSQAKSAGAAADAYGKMADTLQKENDRLDANWKSLWANLGTYFAPFKTDVLDFLNDALEKLNLFIQRSTVARGLNAAGQDVINLQNQLKVQQDSRQNAYARLRDPNVDAEEKARIRADFLPKILAEIDRLKAEIAAAQAVLTATRAAAYGPQQGPQLPGQSSTSAADYGGADTNSSEFQSKVAQQALLKTGVRTADAVVDYCAQWVRLTLGRADKAAAATVNKYFQTDANGDGKTTANDAAQNLRAAGLMKQYRSTKDLKPGDLVFYEDGGAGHVGVYIGGGLVRGNNRVTYRESGGPVDSKGNPTDYSGRYNAVGNVAINRLGQVTGYARPDDVAGFVPKPTTTTPPPAKDVQVTAALIVRAQQLLDKVEAAQKAAQAKPGDPALKVAYNNATKELEAWTKANEANADALAAVRDTQEKAARTTGQYIATQADLKKYGADALKLYKALELAQESGSAAAVVTAERNIATWQGESKAKKAVYDAEAAAYKVRQANAEAADRDAKRAETEAEQDRKKAEEEAKRITANRLAAERALTDGQRAIAKQRAQSVVTDYQNELKAAGDNAQARLAVEQRLGQEVLKARNVLSTVSAQEEKTRLERERNTAVNAEGVTRDQRVRLWNQYAQRIAQVDAGLQDTLRENAAETGRIMDAAQANVWQEDDAERARIYADRVKGYLSDLTAMTAGGLIEVYTEARAHRDQELLAAVYEEWERRRLKAETDAQAEMLVLYDLQAEGNKAVADQAQRTADLLAQDGEVDAALQVLTEGLDEVMAAALRGEDAADAINLLTDAINNLTASSADADAFNGFVAGLTGTIDEQIAQVVDRLDDPTLSRGLKARFTGLLADLRKDLPVWDPNIYAGNLIPGANGFQNTSGSGDTTGLDANADARDLMARIEAATDVNELRDLLTQWDALLLDKGDELGEKIKADMATVRQGAEGYIDVVSNITTEAVKDGLRGVADDLTGEEVTIPVNIDATITKLEGDLEGLYARSEAGEDVVTQINDTTDALNRLYAAKTRAAQAPMPAEVGGTSNRFEYWEGVLTSGQTDYSNPEAVSLLVGELEAARRAGELTDAQLRTLKATVQDLAAGPVVEGEFIPTQTQERVISLVNNVAQLREGLEQGTLTVQDFTGSAVSLLPTLDAVLAGLVASGQGSSELAVLLREAREELLKLGGAALDTTLFLQGFAKFTSSLGSVFRGFGANDLGAVVDSLGQVVEQAGRVPAAFNAMKTSWTAFTQAPGLGTLGGLLGGLGGVMNIAGAVIGAIVGIGNAIEAMSPSIQAWKKDLREVAEEQKKALGANTGGFKSPWAAALEADAEARDRLASSNWLQRLGWSLFGGAPEVMKTESARLLAELQTIFADLGSGVANIWQNTMLTAFRTGDMQGWAENFSKEFDLMFGETVLKTLINAAITEGAVANDLAALTEAVKNKDWAALPGILARAKSSAQQAGAEIAAVAPMLPGYGSGGSSGPTGYTSAPPAAQLGVPRLELSFPTDVFRGLTDFRDLAVPEFRAGIAEWRQINGEFRAAVAQLRPAGPPPPTDLGGLT